MHCPTCEIITLVQLLISVFIVCAEPSECIFTHEYSYYTILQFDVHEKASLLYNSEKENVSDSACDILGNNPIFRLYA